MLGVVVTAGLNDAEEGFSWGELVVPGDSASRPSAGEVVEVATRLFAARLEANRT